MPPGADAGIQHRDQRLFISTERVVAVVGDMASPMVR
jgi:hypothetical protein